MAKIDVHSAMVAASVIAREGRTQKKRIPLGRLGKLRDVADTAGFLASDMARYKNGAAVLVDGGPFVNLQSRKSILRVVDPHTHLCDTRVVRRGLRIRSELTKGQSPDMFVPTSREVGVRHIGRLSPAARN